jgi:hypothetical protein
VFISSFLEGRSNPNPNPNPKLDVNNKKMVNISIDGVLCLKIVDPICASYGVENPIYAIM